MASNSLSEKKGTTRSKLLTTKELRAEPKNFVASQLGFGELDEENGYLMRSCKESVEFRLGPLKPNA